MGLEIPVSVDEQSREAYAAAGGHTDMATALVTAGADVTLRDGSFSATPAAWARFFGHTALFDVLTKLGG